MGENSQENFSAFPNEKQLTEIAMEMEPWEMGP